MLQPVSGAEGYVLTCYNKNANLYFQNNFPISPLLHPFYREHARRGIRTLQFVFLSKTNKFSGTTIDVATDYLLDRMVFGSWWCQNCLHFHIVHTRSGAHPDSYSVRTSGSFSRGKGAEA
jgi:hypothetical protein